MPGGKLDFGEQPEQTVIRELREELGFEIEVIDIISAYLYTIHFLQDKSGNVLIVSYLCKLLNKSGTFETEGEAGKAEFQRSEIENVFNINMPKFYKEAIDKAWRIMNVVGLMPFLVCQAIMARFL